MVVNIFKNPERYGLPSSKEPSNPGPAKSGLAPTLNEFRGFFKRMADPNGLPLPAFDPVKPQAGPQIPNFAPDFH